jgi:hypothetical protein
MGLDSSIFLTRAVFLSLLLHGFVLFLMSFFLTLNPPAEVFPKIKVYFSAPTPELSGSETNITAPEQPVAETVRKVVKEVVSAMENSVPSILKQETPHAEEAVVLPITDSPSFEKAEPELQEQSAFAEETEMQESSAQLAEQVVISDPEVASINVEVDVDAEAGEQLETPGINSDIAAGSSDNADLEWQGGAAVLRSVPDPSFQLPYNAILPDIIMISFIVQSDGTVRSIKILPPGSGHVNLDQQIRTYVNSFIFDPFAASEEEKKGLLRLSLRERGGGSR